MQPLPCCTDSKQKHEHKLGNAHADMLGTFLPYMHVTSFSASLFYLYFLLSHTWLLRIYSSLQPLYCHSSLQTIYCHKPFQWQNILSYLRLCQFTFQYNKQRTLYSVSPQIGTESAFLPKLKNKRAKARPFSFQAEELLLSEDTSVTNFSRERATFGTFSHTCDSKIDFKLSRIHHHNSHEKATGGTHLWIMKTVQT